MHPKRAAGAILQVNMPDDNASDGESPVSCPISLASQHLPRASSIAAFQADKDVDGDSSRQATQSPYVPISQVDASADRAASGGLASALGVLDAWRIIKECSVIVGMHPDQVRVCICSRAFAGYRANVAEATDKGCT